jgi:hypothetical protein
MDAKFADTGADRFHIAEEAPFEPLDPGNHNAPDRGVCQRVEPSGEPSERLDAETKKM